MINPITNQQIGRYHLRHQYGDRPVYYAVAAGADGTEEHVVLKTSENPRLADSKRSLLHELTVLGHLRHPNIVESVGYHRNIGDIDYLVLAWAGNSNLQCFNAGKDRVLQYFLLAQVASALSCIHQMEFVNNDVKLENVAYDGIGRATMVDLGSASYAGSRLSGIYRPQTKGTSGCIAPEVKEGAKPDFPQDVYSFCLMSARMLLGWEKTDQLVGRRFFRNHFIGRALKEECDGVGSLIAQGLHRNPRKRPVMQEMYAGLCRKLDLDVEEVVRGEECDG